MLHQIVVKSGPDEADAKILELCDEKDLVISADIPLAAQLVEKGVLVINPRGQVYDEENVGSHLATRNLMSDLRDEGMITRGQKSFSDRDRQQFASSLDKYITQLQR